MTRSGTGPDARRKVLFVCTANISRSPIAEAIFNALAPEQDIPYKAQSAGTAALVGEPMAPYAKAALEEVGIYTEGHRARQVDAAMLEEADLVFAMTSQHAATLRRLSPEFAEKVHTLSGYACGAPDGEGITDPYGLSMSAYRASVRRIFECVNLLLGRLTC